MDDESTSAMSMLAAEATQHVSSSPPISHRSPGEHVADAARLEGKQPPVLYTLSRDGALHSWVFLPNPEPPDAAGAPASAEGADDDMEEDAAEGAVAAVRPAFTGGCQRASYAMS